MSKLINKELVKELLNVLKILGYNCQLVGGGAYTLYTEDSATSIKDLDIRFPIMLNNADAERFAAVGITLTRYLDVNAIGSYRDCISHRPSTLGVEFVDRIKYLTKAKYKGIDVDLLVFNVETLPEILDTFDITFNCIAFNGTDFIEGSLFDANVGRWLKPITEARRRHMLDKFSHKEIL